MRSVLIVSYSFPPQYDVSARRAAKLCKYLPASGWRPVVLTKDWTRDVAEEDRQAYAITAHPDVLAELRDTTVVRVPYRTRDNVLRRLHRLLGGAYASASTRGADRGVPGSSSRSAVAARRALSLASPTFGDFPDAFRGWVRDAVRAGTELARSESVDAICSLCPPATAHVVASEIARRTRLPWVAQFDDLFSFHLESQPRLAWRAYAGLAHRRWMRRATLAGAITPGMLDYVRRTYGLDGDVVSVGFDPDESPVVQPSSGDRLRLAYTGSVYLDNHRPEILFEALERVLSARPPADRRIEVVFAGTRCDRELRARAAPFPTASAACVFLDRLAPDATLRLQREAHALVLFNYTTPASAGGTLSFPAKTFEYLNARRPILAIPRDPGGWGNRLLRATRAGSAADTAAEAAGILADWLAAWEDHGAVPYCADDSEIERYAQPRQAATLARLLDNAVAHHRGA